jgi:anti-anti-sigma factor
MNTGAQLRIEIENDPHCRVIVLKGRLDLLTLETFTDFINHEIIQGARQVLIDCSALEYISSAGIGELVAAGKALSALGGSLAFAAPTKSVGKVFETVGFPRLYTIYESRNAARAEARWLSGWR